MSSAPAPLSGHDAMLLRRLVRAQLRLLEELGSPYGNASEADVAPVIGGPKDVYELLAPEMGPLEQEQLRVLLLDTRHRVLDVVTLYQGAVNQTPARIAELFRDAVRADAPAIVIAHTRQANPKHQPMTCASRPAPPGRVSCLVSSCSITS